MGDTTGPGVAAGQGGVSSAAADATVAPSRLVVRLRTWAM